MTVNNIDTKTEIFTMDRTYFPLKNSRWFVIKIVSGHLCDILIDRFFESLFLLKNNDSKNWQIKMSRKC